MIYNLLYFWFYALTYTRGLPAISSPLLPFDDPLSDSISNLTSREVQPRDGKPFYLRIAPLGASITNGYLSSDGNGYRKHLRDQLRLAGWPVNMVGSIHSGSMNDDDNEGHLGWLISQVADSALPNIVPAQPNVVLINVGTNNANFTDDVSNAYNEYINLLDKLWQGIPAATVVLSTLLPNKYGPTNNKSISINKQIRGKVLSHYHGQNKSLVLADMNDGFITTADLNDDIHPTDAGYKKMAAVWWAALQEAEKNGLLTAPPDVGVPDNSTGAGQHTCPKAYGDGDGNHQIQKGSGTDDGKYIHRSADQGVIWESPFGVDSKNENYGNNVFFAQLINAGGNTLRGGEVDEIIWARPSHSKWEWELWINNNNNNFGETIGFDTGYACSPEFSRFADMNNDGLDDYICIDVDGNLFASINRGGNPPKFEAVGQIASAPSFWHADGYGPDRVRMADIDGDGRADWCIVLLVGDVACLRNAGVGDLPKSDFGGFWQYFATDKSEFTTVFLSQNRDNDAGVNLVDMNGDFKADWLSMTTSGQVDTYINNRGGTELLPDWQDAGGTHGGLSSFGVINAHSAVKFGRMYGTGRRDYIWIQKVGDPGVEHLQLRVWKNLGSGGTYLKGDGTNYCDMDGDGVDDYIWVGPNGEIDIYLNINNPPLWDNHLGVVTLGVARKTIRIADLDGDGKCDLLSVDPLSGAVRMWLNSWDASTKTWSFTDHGIVSGNAECRVGDGVIENDHAVRFADLTGDGTSDYLCIERDGRISGYLNRGMSSQGHITFEDVGQIKLQTTYERQDVRFNDVNGDGRADLLYIDKFSGDTVVWYNAGEIPTSGSHFKWEEQGTLYKAWDRGSNMNFGALGGQHRADIIQVIPRTNVAYISYNKCPGGSGSGGDDPNMGDPKLPLYNSSSTCIDSNGDGSCEIIDSDIEISFPPNTYLPPFQSPTSYGEGDAFLFDTPIRSDINLNLILTGGKTEWKDTNCGSISATGVNGGTLGCIAAAVAWVTYSIYLHDGPVTNTPTRSLSSSNHHLQLHSHWEPVENCTTKCKLVGRAPQNTWTSVGNGTYDGIFHELQFMHTDKFTAHRAYQAVDPHDSALSARSRYDSNGYPHKPLGWGPRPIYIDVYTPPDDPPSYKATFDEYPSAVGAADWMGEAVEESVAVSNFSGFCFTLINGGEVVSSSLLGISQTEAPWRSPDQIEKDLAHCAAEQSRPDKHLGTVLLICGANLTWIDPSLLDDPEREQGSHTLNRRNGGSNTYQVHNYLDPNGMTVTFESAPYVNGRNGQALIDAGGDSHVYGFANPGRCTDASIRDDAPISGPDAIDVDAEHTIERITVPNFLEFVQNPEYDLADGNGVIRAPANLQAIPFNIIRQYMAIPYREWPNIPEDLTLPADQSLFSDMADALGSTSNVEVMTNLESPLNGVKSRIWDASVLVTSEEVWKPLVETPTVANTQNALDLLRSGIVVHNYLNADNVQKLMAMVHHGLRDSNGLFDSLFNTYVTSHEPTNMRDLWITYINFRAQRIANRHLSYVNNRLHELQSSWNNVLAQNPSQEDQLIAQGVLADIEDLRRQTPELIFKRDKFT